MGCEGLAEEEGIHVEAPGECTAAIGQSCNERDTDIATMPILRGGGKQASPGSGMYVVLLHLGTKVWIFDGANQARTRGTPRDASWEVYMLTCWAIWKGRCKFVFEQKLSNTCHSQGNQIGCRRADDCLTGSDEHKNGAVNRGILDQTDNGVIKINCDASWCSTTKQGGIRVIARDHEGHVCEGYHRQIDGGSI